jgi:flavodoxin
MSKILVAYFSASGVTKKLAEKIAAAVAADISEIVPEQPYTPQDLDWQDSGSRSSVEMKDADARPAIKYPVKTDGYDVIFLGFPIWWYTAPMIIRTFLESADFSGKTIVLFATSGSSKMGKTMQDLKPFCPSSVTWKDGGVIKGAKSNEELAAWAKDILA